MSLSDQLNDILASLGGFGPPTWLSVSFCVLLLVELLLLRSDRARTRKILAALSAVVITVAGVWAALSSARGFLFMHLLFVDNQAVFMQVVVALSALFVLLYDVFTHSDNATSNSINRSGLWNLT